MFTYRNQLDEYQTIRKEFSDAKEAISRVKNQKEEKKEEKKEVIPNSKGAKEEAKKDGGEEISRAEEASRPKVNT